MAEAKGRKVQKKDWDRIETFVKGIYDERKDSTFRKEHEGKWKEIDRQIAMNPLKRMSGNKELPNSWHSVLELGELSKASEIITSDVMRIAFPTDKTWFQPHVQLEWPTDEQTGKPAVDSKKQKIADGLLRSLMGQQHQDFGLKARIRLSIKEALHHGSFVSEIGFEKKLLARDGGQIRMVGSPVWKPYSMWNCYPDPSPSVTGSDMFYDGSMVLVDYMPLWKLKAIGKGEGWMQDRLSKIEKESHKTKTGETKDVEIIKSYGDISIDRADGDIFLPNSKVLLANDTIVFWASNDLPYPPIIFSGYERQDVRDPYFTSPIIKQSPVQKAASVTMNKFLDAAALKVEPPIEYDGNDPDYVVNDGPSIVPGAKTPTKSMGKGMNVLDIGNPDWALKALEMFLRQQQEGTGVSALRSGTTNSDRQTAFEVNKVAQGAEVRTIEFVSQLEPAFRTYLYMQHELNRKYMEEYEFYNEELHTPDVLRAKNRDIQANAHFEVVGTRGLLGEEQRTQRTTQVTAFASQNPLFATLLKPEVVLMDMYRDAGKKNPEDWVKSGDQQPSAQDQALKMQLQQMQQLLQKFAEENKQLKSKHEEKMAELSLDAKKHSDDLALDSKKHSDDIQKHAAEIQNERQQFAAQLAEQKREFDREFSLRVAELKVEMAENQNESLKKASDIITNVADKVVELEKAQKSRKKKKVTSDSGKVYTVEDL